MAQTTNDRGNVAFIAILCFIVIAAASATGWYIWQKKHTDVKTSSTTAAQTRQPKQTQSKQPAHTKPADPSEGGKYLVIKEWGVKIPLTDEISRAYYKFSSGPTSESVALYDAAFDDMHNANGVSCGNGNEYLIYAISRVGTDYSKATHEGDVFDYEKVPFTNEYLFGGVGAHQTAPFCSFLNSDPYSPAQYDQHILDTKDKKEAAFDKAFKNLRSDIQ